MKSEDAIELVKDAHKLSESMSEGGLIALGAVVISALGFKDERWEPVLDVFAAVSGPERLTDEERASILWLLDQR